MKEFSKQATDLARMIAKDIADNPQDWEADRFAVENNKLGYRVWIANGHYGIDVVRFVYLDQDSSKSDLPSYFSSPKSFKVIGGVTMLSTFFGWLIPWRRIAYKAATNHYKAVLSGAINGT